MRESVQEDVRFIFIVKLHTLIYVSSKGLELLTSQTNRSLVTIKCKWRPQKFVKKGLQYRPS